MLVFREVSFRASWKNKLYADAQRTRLWQKGSQQMTATQIKRAELEPVVRPSPILGVILHNDWENSMVQVVVILRKSSQA